MIYYAFPLRHDLSQAIQKLYFVTWNQFIPLILPNQFRLIASPSVIQLQINLGIWESSFSCTWRLHHLKKICITILHREAKHPSVPYHYYEPKGPDECAMYISHERGRRGSHHRFITEKRVFANWARTFDIHFYQPDWSPAPLPRNSTGTTVLSQSRRT